MKKQTINLPIFGTWVKVLISETYSSLHREALDSYGIDLTKDTPPFTALSVCHRAPSQLENYMFFVESEFDEGIAAHEIMHTVYNILDYYSTPLTNDTEEIYALLTEYITNNIFSNE